MACVWQRLAAMALLCNALAAPAQTPPPPVAGYSAKGADTCLGCHGAPAVTVIFRTKHARSGDPRSPFGHGGLQCEACHGPGAAHAAAGGNPLSGIVTFGKNSTQLPAIQNASCIGCHAADAAHDWAVGPHAINDIACSSCHSLHAARDPVRTPTGEVEVCSKCHQVQHSDLFKPSHHPLREGKMGCTSCHTPHGATTPAQLQQSTVNATCTSCHTEFRGPFLWEHQPATEDCTNCHDPHGSAQASLLKVRPPFLCQQCHEGAGHPSIANSPQGLAGSAPSAFLLGRGCVNCHSQVHGSNHPSGRDLMR